MNGEVQVAVVDGKPPESIVAGGPLPDAEHVGLDKLKAHFLASLNHEVRTPLSGIIGMTDLLMETELSTEQKEYVSSARVCAENLLELLNTTLEYSALAAGTLTLDEYEFNLGETLELAVAEHINAARQKNLAVTFSYDDELPATVIGDPRRLRQLVSHLVSNAVKFTHEGRVDIAARRTAAGDLMVTVEDTGIGIDESKLSLIFESFRQVDGGLARRYAGLGLGLALAQKIATLHGGRVDVESAPGKGSRFTVRVPLHPPMIAAPDHSRAAAEQDGPSVLVVEDNRVAQTVISHVLRRHRFRVSCVDSGVEAVRQAKQQRFNLILMDLQMPEMDGLEATALIRKLPDYAEVPIIALTANYSDQYREWCHRCGMQGFLSKPVHPAELIANVKRFV